LHIRYKLLTGFSMQWILMVECVSL